MFAGMKMSVAEKWRSLAEHGDLPDDLIRNDDEDNGATQQKQTAGHPRSTQHMESADDTYRAISE